MSHLRNTFSVFSTIHLCTRRIHIVYYCIKRKKKVFGCSSRKISGQRFTYAGSSNITWKPHNDHQLWNILHLVLYSNFTTRIHVFDQRITCNWWEKRFSVNVTLYSISSSFWYSITSILSSVSKQTAFSFCVS